MVSSQGVSLAAETTVYLGLTPATPQPLYVYSGSCRWFSGHVHARGYQVRSWLVAEVVTVAVLPSIILTDKSASDGTDRLFRLLGNFVGWRF